MIRASAGNPACRAGEWRGVTGERPRWEIMRFRMNTGASATEHAFRHHEQTLNSGLHSRMHRV